MYFKYLFWIAHNVRILNSNLIIYFLFNCMGWVTIQCLQFRFSPPLIDSGNFIGKYFRVKNWQIFPNSLFCATIFALFFCFCEKNERVFGEKKSWTAKYKSVFEAYICKIANWCIQYSHFLDSKTRFLSIFQCFQSYTNF